MENKLEIVQIEVNNIIPNPKQPRKYFNPHKIKTLADSIKEYGIRQPLTVTKEGSKYKLVNGERRFRALQTLKEIKKVPCIIQNSKNEAETLLIQFHLQEQHEGWTAAEKGMAMIEIAKKLKKPIREIAKQIGYSESQASCYEALTHLHNQESFIKGDLPLGHARHFKQIKNLVKTTYQQEKKNEFTEKMDKAVENNLVKMCIAGQIKDKDADFVKIIDAIKAKPQNIEKLIKGTKESADKMFLSAKAQSQKDIRQVANACFSMRLRAKSWIKDPNALPTEAQYAVIRETLKLLSEVEKIAHKRLRVGE